MREHWDRDKNYAGKILTQSGVEFDIQKPLPSMVNIEDIAHSLSMQCRYNGHIPSFYSVAEHSVRVAWYLERNRLYPLVKTGLLHDSAEAYLGDMVQPMKAIEQLGRLFKAYEEAVEFVVGQAFDITLYPMPPEVKEADHAVYQWEVDNIRTGKEKGWDPEYSRKLFMQTFLNPYSPESV